MATMEQFAEAVTVMLSGLGYPQDVKLGAMQYLQDIKTSDEDWVICAEMFCSGDFDTDVRFQCLGVLDYVVADRYESLTAAHQQSLKELVMGWISNAPEEPAPIRNKAAQFLVHIFIHEFPDGWPDFFDDLLSTVEQDSATSFDFLFRTLQTIDEVVVDRELSRSPEELARNTHIKDCMREGHIAKLAETWDHCISEMADTHQDIAEMALEVITAFVAWIDIELVVNDATLGVLFALCEGNLDLRAASCTCIQAIVSKGMLPSDKTSLIDTLDLHTFIENQFANLENDDENEYSIALAKLANCLGLQLIDAIDVLHKANEDFGQTAEVLERCIDTAIGVMGSEYDDVSEATVDVAIEYLHLVKVLPGFGQEEKIAKLLETVISKMRYDNHFNYDDQGGDENEFLDFRKVLGNVFDNICDVAPEIFYRTCTDVVESTLTNLPERLEHGELNFADVELSLHVIYLMHSAGKPDYRDETAVVEAFTTVMMLATDVDVQLAESHAVNVKFCEVCFRHGKFFQDHSDRIPVLLGAFLGDGGVLSPSAHVRSMSAYNFLRFIRKDGRQILYPYIEEIFGVIEPMLDFNSPALDLDDQKWLAEIIGQLATSDAASAEDHRRVLEPFVDSMVEKALEIQTVHFEAASSDEEVLELVNGLTYVISLTSALTKGLKTPAMVSASGLDEAFGRALQVYIRCLQIPVHKDRVHKALVVYLHRMIACLGKHVLALIPDALSALLDVDKPNLEDLQLCVPLINQLITKFKGTATPLVDAVFMPLTRVVFDILQSDVDADDLSTLHEHATLKRVYYEFLNSCTKHGLAHIFTTEENAEHAPDVLAAVLEGTKGVSPKSQKICFEVFRQLMEPWFGQDDGLDGFDDFVFSEVIPRALTSILEQADALVGAGDAWAYLMVGEVADLLLAGLRIAGPGFIDMMFETSCALIELPPAAADELARLLLLEVSPDVVDEASRTQIKRNEVQKGLKQVVLTLTSE